MAVSCIRLLFCDKNSICFAKFPASPCPLVFLQKLIFKGVYYLCIQFDGYHCSLIDPIFLVACSNLLLSLKVHDFLYIIVILSITDLGCGVFFLIGGGGMSLKDLC